MGSRVDVFISSTTEDLKEYRFAARDAVLTAGLYPIMMEYWGANSTPPSDYCLKKVGESDIYVGIFAHRYGFCPEGEEISMTEMEYNKALAIKIPRLCFLIDKQYFDWPPEHIDSDTEKDKLDKFKAKIEKHVIRATFTTPESLKSQMLASLRAVVPTEIKVLQTNENKTRLYELEAKLQSIRSDYIRFQRGTRRNDPDEHQKIISVAQEICTLASMYDDKPRPPSRVLNLVMTHGDWTDPEKFEDYQLIHEQWKDSLRYISRIWLTVNQVEEKHNATEFRLWNGDYERRNIAALDHAIKRLDELQQLQD